MLSKGVHHIIQTPLKTALWSCSHTVMNILYANLSLQKKLLSLPCRIYRHTVYVAEHYFWAHFYRSRDDTVTAFDSSWYNCCCFSVFVLYLFILTKETHIITLNHLIYGGEPVLPIGSYLKSTWQSIWPANLTYCSAPETVADVTYTTRAIGL